MSKQGSRGVTPTLQITSTATIGDLCILCIAAAT